MLIFQLSPFVKIEKQILIEINILISFVNLIHYVPKVLWTLSLPPINYSDKTRWQGRGWERIHPSPPGSSPAESSRHQTSCVVQMNRKEGWWGEEKGIWPVEMFSGFLFCTVQFWGVICRAEIAKFFRCFLKSRYPFEDNKSNPCYKALLDFPHKY